MEGLHRYETARTDKAMGAERGLVAFTARAGAGVGDNGRGVWVSVWGDGNVLELDGADGCRTWRIY